MATAEEYREKLLITHIRILEHYVLHDDSYAYDSWAVCPRCYSSIDREYKAFCSVCGQHLDWSGYDDAEFVYGNEKILNSDYVDEPENEKPCRKIKRQGLFRRIISKLCGLKK